MPQTVSEPQAIPDPNAERDSPTVSGKEARQGTVDKRLRYVLAISLFLAAAVVAIAASFAA